MILDCDYNDAMAPPGGTIPTGVKLEMVPRKAWWMNMMMIMMKNGLQNIFNFLLRHYVRSCDETIPEALQKILRPTGSTLLGGGYTVRTLRSIAFQPCITLGGVYWVKMGQNNDFLFLKVSLFSTCVLKNLEHQLRNELWARRQFSILSDWRPLEIFLQSITKKYKIRRFFAFRQIT